MAFSPGDRVRTSHIDPAHHTRLPQYARGRVGIVVERDGEWLLADINASGSGDAPMEAVYAVRFSARDLWGDGDHSVVLNLWSSYLDAAQ